SVVEDHRDRQRDQRLESRPQQPLRVDIGSERARGEADRQQDDQRRDPQLAGQHLRSDRQHQDQAYPEQHLLGRHRPPPRYRARAAAPNPFYGMVRWKDQASAMISRRPGLAGCQPSSRRALSAAATVAGASPARRGASLTGTGWPVTSRTASMTCLLLE